MASTPARRSSSTPSAAVIGCRSWGASRPLETLSDDVEQVEMTHHIQERVHTFCAQLLSDLGVAPPFTAWQLCGRLSEHRQRPIKVFGTDLGGITVIGHLVPLPSKDRILHDDRAPRAQQEHVIYHELMHLLLGHLDDAAEPLTCGSLVSDDEDGQEGAGSWFSDVFEWEAEAGATELARLGALRQRPDEYIAQDHWHPEKGVAATFGLVSSRWTQR